MKAVMTHRSAPQPAAIPSTATITAIALQSGSNGNCIYVEALGVRLLFDAGLSGRRARQGLEAFGIDIRGVDALLISHDHSDHARCAGVYHRLFDLPVYMTPKTLRASQTRQSLGRLGDVRHFQRGETIRFGPVSVQALATPHDGAEAAAFIIEADRKRLGILTDLGHVFTELPRAVSSLDGVFIESNYDPRMLANGPYPAFLKARIQGPHGHISNIESATLLRQSAGTRLKWACLAHLSEQNNRPELALQTHRAMKKAPYKLYAASRHQPSGVFVL